jgi:hypothetical protein
MTSISHQRKDIQAISLRSLILWTFVFILWGILRQKFPAFETTDLINRISVLEVVQVFYIIRLARLIPPDETVSAWVAFGGLTVISSLVLILQFRPTYASGGLEIGLLALSFFRPSMRVFAWAVTLFVFQYLFMAGPFLWLHETVGSIDATVLRGMLQEWGYPALGIGPFVFLDGSVHGVNVMGTCSSSNVIGTIVAGYVIIVLGRRGHLVPQDALTLTLLLVAGLLLNWLRIVPMALSREGHAYWHDGEGAALVSLAFAAIVLAGAFAATRDCDEVKA